MPSTRREFLASSASLATLLASGATLPAFLTRTARGATREHDAPILVIVQLSGGNDGLNTVIPYEDDRYHAARPTLRIPKAQALKLDDQLGLHPEMEAMRALYDDGLLSVISNVGYPNPDRSHFRSMDIWHTGASVPEAERQGWIGRAIHRVPKAADTPAALHLDGDPLPLALKSDTHVVPSINSIDAFRLEGDVETLHSSVSAPRANPTDDLLYVQRVAVSSCNGAERIRAVTRDDQTGAPYPGHGLAGRLRQIAQLIGAGFGARVYYTSMGGFDTHARQGLSHGPLLRELSDSVAAFQRDIDRRGLANNVLLMTFSEFGRRVAENGSRGTDHGAAAPMFLVGKPAAPGIHGGTPDLRALTDGDVAHRIDFRQVYATLLNRWLHLDDHAILAKRFGHLPLLRM